MSLAGERWKVKLIAAFRKASRAARGGGQDRRHINTVNNPLYSSTVVDPESGRRSVMGTGKKSACAILRPSTLAAGAPRTAVVLGVARGGTSMVSGALRGLGVFMGENLGFNHEDTGVQRIVVRKAYDDFAELARARDSAHALWGFKFPEASTVMDKFHPHLREPHYLFVMRHPIARGMSVVTRTGGTLTSAINDALVNYRTILGFVDSTNAPTLLINYEQATENPRASAEQIAQFLGLGQDAEAIDRAASMILGEGAGYLNLPEHSFFAQEAELPDDVALTAVDAEPGELFEKEINYARRRASVWAAPEGGFPKEFWLRFKLARSDDDDRVRLYYDYDGQFHLGHRLLLGLTTQTPTLKVQTTGKLRRLAIVPLAKDGRIKKVRIEAEGN